MSDIRDFAALWVTGWEFTGQTHHSECGCVDGQYREIGVRDYHEQWIRDSSLCTEHGGMRTELPEFGAGLVKHLGRH